jgi:hypothetical protein
LKFRSAMAVMARSALGVLLAVISVACRAAALHPLSHVDSHSLAPHPALEPHARELTLIASKSPNPVGDRVRLWSALRSLAHQRGGQLLDPTITPAVRLPTPSVTTSVLPAHIEQRRQASCFGAPCASMSLHNEERDGADDGARRGGRRERAPPPPTPSGIIRPTDFGADPTGRTDSTVAMQAAMAALLQLGSSRNRSTLSSNITDLAGAVLDLQGGE